MDDNMAAYKNIPSGLENTENMADKSIIHIVEETRRQELIVFPGAGNKIVD